MGKTMDDFSEQSGYRLIATAEVAPDPKYTLDSYYNIQGLDSVFNGIYKIRKATHKISAGEGYSVTLELTKDKPPVTNPTPAEPTRRQPAPTSPSPDLIYTVQHGDASLWDICNRLCKSASSYKEVYSYSGYTPERKAGTNYYWIWVGQKLKIPAHLRK